VEYNVSKETQANQMTYEPMHFIQHKHEV